MPERVKLLQINLPVGDRPVCLIPLMPQNGLTYTFYRFKWLIKKTVQWVDVGLLWQYTNMPPMIFLWYTRQAASGQTFSEQPSHSSLMDVKLHQKIQVTIKPHIFQWSISETLLCRKPTAQSSIMSAINNGRAWQPQPSSAPVERLQ